MSARHRPLVWLAVCVAVCGPVAAGCSRTEKAQTLDTPGTERVIDKVIGSRILPPVSEVRCPTDVERGVGKVFSCQAVLDGGNGEVRLRVRQTDDQGKLDVELLDAVVDHTKVATDLHRTLVKQFHREFSVDCGTDTIVVTKPKATFTCTAKDSAATRTVTVTVTDAAGTTSYAIAPK